MNLREEFNISPEEMENALVAAVKSGDAQEVRDWLGLGADPDARTDGTPLLAYAAGFRNLQIVDALLRAGATPDLTDAVGHTALMRAMERGKLDNAQRLIGAGAEVNFQKVKDRSLTPLFVAAVCDVASHSAQCVEFLMAKGADAGMRMQFMSCENVTVGDYLSFIAKERPDARKALEVLDGAAARRARAERETLSRYRSRAARHKKNFRL